MSSCAPSGSVSKPLRLSTSSNARSSQGAASTSRSGGVHHHSASQGGPGHSPRANQHRGRARGGDDRPRSLALSSHPSLSVVPAGQREDPQRHRDNQGERCQSHPETGGAPGLPQPFQRRPARRRRERPDDPSPVARTWSAASGSCSGSGGPACGSSGDTSPRLSSPGSTLRAPWLWAPSSVSGGLWRPRCSASSWPRGSATRRST